MKELKGKDRVIVDLNDTGTIFVTGGTGVLGYRVTKKLLLACTAKQQQQQQPMNPFVIRFGCHYFHHQERTEASEWKNQKLIEELNELGGEIADFRWSGDLSYDKALQGVKTVFCTTPYVQDWKELFPTFLEACKTAGVQHIVKLSFFHARNNNKKNDSSSSSGDGELLLFQSVPIVRAHGEIDEMLIHSGISYTILAATHFMSNPFYFQNHELRKNQIPAIYYGASGGKGVNYVSPNDIAEMAMHVLLHPHLHQNKEYTITGPESIKDQTVATLLSNHLRKPIIFADQPLHAFEEGEKKSGDPEWMVNDLVALENIKSTGIEELLSFVTKDFEKICHHEPQSFEEYLKATELMTPMEAA